ncbi:protein inturned [Musca vetustissima]|uniref:protein inturned n=1 Tax=Musca vetustissima TaxID=27455 RepID=UPI002AB74038|nr:protein inturned [Musca vetustissima]
MRRYNPDFVRSSTTEADSDSNSEDESYSNSYSDSEFANWEQYVCEDGSLFYIEYIPIDMCKTTAPTMEATGEGKVEFQRDLPSRSGKKGSRRPNKEEDKPPPKATNDSILFSNVNTSEDSCKTLELVITAADRYRFGRRSTAVESILGFSVVPFVDKPECLMVDAFIHDMPEFFQQGKHIPIGRGDWLKSLDNIEIRASNIDDLLLQFDEPTKVCLKFQGQNSLASSVDLRKETEGSGPTYSKIENYSQFSMQFEQLQKSLENTASMAFGLLILPPECYQNDEHKKYNPDFVRSSTTEADSDSNSEDESYSNSYSDSEFANWEQYVCEDGSLFYIEYIPIDMCKTTAPTMEATGEGKVEFQRDLPSRSGKKGSRRPNKEEDKPPPKATNDSILFSNVNTSEDSCKTLELVITAADRYRFGRRSTAVESILGFSVVPFVDKPECLMVDAFIHDMPEFFQQGKHIPIGRGDWLKSLDNIEIRASNIDDLLLQFDEPTKVCLKFQGQNSLASSVDLRKETEGSGPTYSKIENYSQFSMQFEQLQKSLENTASMAFGLLILPPECYQNDEHKKSLYYYPDNPDNFLYKARGSFLTLSTVLTEELKTKPFASQLSFNNEEYVVFYRNLNGFLVLFSYLASMVTIPEGNLRADELLTYISFMQPQMSLDSFKNATFIQFMHNFCNIQRIRLMCQKDRHRGGFPLEEAIKESRHLPLPKEAQLRIFDALSEMEAMDYRNWNDEPLNTHREFFIYGSTLYYDCFMLTSQMPLEMRQYVETFLRCRGVFEFSAKHGTKELYIWEEVKLPDMSDRYFLAVCGRGHLLLTVILKLFCPPDFDINSKVLPSLFYIEEIQETLDHLLQCGIESLAMFWAVSNKRPEVQNLFADGKLLDSSKEGKRNDLTLIRRKSSPSSASASHAQRSVHYEEDTQLCSSLGGSSVHSLTPSEDDSSKKRLIANADDSDSGSDWENFMEENILRCAIDAELQSQVTESLWKEISNVVPINISSGCLNNIYYYIYVDGTNCTSFSPLKSAKDTAPFAREMHLGFHAIRKTLRSTRHRRDWQRTQNTRDLMIPIKEHGLTVQVVDKTSLEKYKFAVIGRLFLSPPREVYICHRPDMPANMVELAFRLSFFASG